MKKIVDCTTGEEFERELNDAELAQWEKDNAISETQKASEAAKAAAKAALLAKLGIDEDEARLLLG